MEKIDNFAGAGMPQAPVQTETANTTSLDNLAQVSVPTPEASLAEEIAPELASPTAEMPVQSEPITDITAEAPTQLQPSAMENSEVSEQAPQAPVPDIIPGVYQ